LQQLHLRQPQVMRQRLHEAPVETLLGFGEHGAVWLERPRLIESNVRCALAPGEGSRHHAENDKNA